MCLTGTAEIPLGGVCMDRILPEAQLPLKMAAFGHCFRTEAGAAGSGALRPPVSGVEAARCAVPRLLRLRLRLQLHWLRLRLAGAP